ncbi:cupredoxin-like protein [Roseiarcus fermentans]|uniref:Cupredoxin-like protein n=1 Tax=Roseiarcus fermentans TaxID=1473586 RepID=A0A366FC47_9HYPH|nr:cupredoxin-like protein [Roseiarcus fermentans]
MRATLAATLAALFAAAAAAAPAGAEDEGPTFQIVFKGGAIEPKRLEVPARTRFRLEISNEDDTAAEFESVELHKEKVLAPRSKTVMVIRTLDPGEYDFFDDFHPGAAAAVLVAK